MTKSPIDILSDDPIRHHETFILKPKAKVKFTTVFKLDHESVSNTLPQYFDIYPHLNLFNGKWWSFKTESSSFIFRRSLETILSHAMPLPWVEGETYRPYFPHNHDLINMHLTWCSFLCQAFYLLEIDKVLQQQNTAHDAVKDRYRKRIREVIFGVFTFLLMDAEKKGAETASPYQPMKPVKKGEAGELAGEVKRDSLSRAPERSSEAEVVEPVGPVRAPAAEVDPADPKTDPPFPSVSPESTRGLNRTSTPQPGETEESVDPHPVRPIEPELFKYEDSFEDCCRFFILLDKCLTNYPDEKSLITRMVETFLKLAWEPIEMSEHQGSHLWPDRLESMGGFPPPYARFLKRESNQDCGYGGQGIYVYDITIQVVVWHAVKSANNLLRLVSENRNWRKWMDDKKGLDHKAIRDRTIEAFRLPGTDTSQSSSPDRFVSKIRGHVRERFLKKRACTIAIPSLVDDFFFDDNNKPISAWEETLKYCDTLSNSSKGQTPDTWEFFMRYQLGIDGDNRQELRKSLEARAYSVGLFASDMVTPSSHGLCPPYWDIVTHVLSADYAGFTHPQPGIQKIIDLPTRAGGARGYTLPQEGLVGAGTNPVANIIGVSGKKGKCWYITAEDLRQVNDPPSYGESYWFRDPLFMKYEPEKPEINKDFINDFLQSGYDFAREDSGGNWCCFWETNEGEKKFLESIEDMSNYEWGGSKNILIQLYRNRKPDLTDGSTALSGLQEQRDRGAINKRIIVMKDCSIEHLISLMANLDYQEAGHIKEFLLRLPLMDSHEMRFEEQTIMPDNLWITEFNINFITAPLLADVEVPSLPNSFPRRRGDFLRMNDTMSGRIMSEVTMGFRFIGDLHDRYWTCYVFYNFGSQKLITDTWTGEEGGPCKTPRQRKCLEGFLVLQALDLVLSETKTVLDTIEKSIGEDNKSQELFIPLLTEDDLRGEDYFKTMKKNSVVYPWQLEVYGALRGKCSESRSVAMLWISAEERREHKPRWSGGDQRKFGKEIAQNRADVKSRCAKLEKMVKNLRERIDRIKTRKQSLSSELALREARTSAQLAHTVNLFAVVTAIYLPLTFSTSIVAIQDFQSPSPAKALIRIALPVTFGTIILLMNLAFLRGILAALKRWAQHSIRQRMTAPPKPKIYPKEPICQEKRPAWKYWKKRADSLQEAEKRSALLTDNDIHGSESDWWYWCFMAIFIMIVIPVQELFFIIRTLRGQRIQNAGPLKKIVRLPWAPIWVLQLALVYVVMLAGYAFLSWVRLVYRAAVWLWTGDDTAEGKKAPPEEVEKSWMSDLEGDEEGSEPEPGSTQEDGGLIDWLMKPVKKMMLLIVKEALEPKKKKETGPEEHGTAMEDLAALPPN
ncbi:hypothetical protein HOY80DRAFT_1091638 [Tuber brumale]|nr:hypothetical protein HOY80DRAFT_1091638 [Tuber brumale]